MDRARAGDHIGHDFGGLIEDGVREFRVCKLLGILERRQLLRRPTRVLASQPFAFEALTLILALLKVERQRGLLAHHIGGCEVGIRALALLPLPTERRGAGERDVPVQIDGTWVRPGDVLYADEDGIVVMPAPA